MTILHSVKNKIKEKTAARTNQDLTIDVLYFYSKYFVNNGYTFVRLLYALKMKADGRTVNS